VEQPGRSAPTGVLADRIRKDPPASALEERHLSGSPEGTSRVSDSRPATSELEDYLL
jgi:hypothetical protein